MEWEFEYRKMYLTHLDVLRNMVLETVRVSELYVGVSVLYSFRPSMYFREPLTEDPQGRQLQHRDALDILLLLFKTRQVISSLSLVNLAGMPSAGA